MTTDANGIDDDAYIDGYVVEVASHLIGPQTARDRATEELASHLTGAAVEGDLHGALERLGAPADAATTFAPRSQPVPIGRRLHAVAVDHAPLVAVTIVLLVERLATAAPGTTIRTTLPPIIAVETDAVCVSPLPLVCDTGFHATPDAGSLALVAAALFWSIVGLAVFEARTGQTPGKRLAGIYTIGDDGLRVGFARTVARRASLLLGPLAWLDWLPYLWGDQRRISDHATGTQVGQFEASALEEHQPPGERRVGSVR